jgi:2-polyprenyl-6-methoxyphenol hydroxylase-like FAD-dependent oxidoreductase
MKHLVIVGGGTSGWLAAMMLGETARQKRQALKVTVVESSRIPVIGVGEASTVVLSFVLQHLGIDPLTFLRETRGSIKLGIRHKDWRRVGYTYQGPLDEPHQLVKGAGGSQFLNVYEIAAGRPVAALHLFDTLMRHELSPYRQDPDGDLTPVSPYAFAYHFDNAELGRFLRRRADGPDVVDALVTGVERDSGTGAIAAVVLDDGSRIAGDFFIDCTGFRRQLIQTEMGADWLSYSEELPVNRAMPFWLEHGPDKPISPYTLAWAREAGWMWFIPTQDRYGCGYVYSDRFLTPDQAKDEVERALGHKIEPRADIRMAVGRLDRPWIGNCLAMGLASGFLEPLEATSIHGTIVQLLVFSADYMKWPFEPSADAIAEYNRRIGRQFDDFRTFVNCHYVTERDDTPFWRHVRDHCIHPEARERLTAWREHMPRSSDFPSFLSGFPHTDATLYYPVLDGLGLLDRGVAQREMAQSPKLREKAREIAPQMRRSFSGAAGGALGHREFLETVAGAPI